MVAQFRAPDSAAGAALLAGAGASLRALQFGSVGGGALRVSVGPSVGVTPLALVPHQGVGEAFPLTPVACDLHPAHGPFLLWHACEAHDADDPLP
eukprot:3255057-Pyramimonas_sp.AAC.1